MCVIYWVSKAYQSSVRHDVDDPSGGTNIYDIGHTRYLPTLGWSAVRVAEAHNQQEFIKRATVKNLWKLIWTRFNDLDL